MCGNEADSPPQRRNTPNFDLLFVLFRATWGMWAVWGKSPSRNMISLQKSGKSHHFMIFQEIHAFVWIAMHFMGCTEHQFSLRKTNGSGTPFRAKCLKSSKIMNFTEFMVFHEKHMIFVKWHIVVKSALLREKPCPEPLIFHKEYWCFQGRGAKVCFWPPKSWNLANFKEICDSAWIPLKWPKFGDFMAQSIFSPQGMKT